MEHCGQISTIIQNHVGVPRFAVCEDGLLDTPLVLLFGFTFPSKNRHTRCGDRGGGMILRGEYIAGRPADFSAQLNKCLDQHAGLNGHVNAAKNFGACQRLCILVLLSQRHQRWHFAFRDL